MTANCSYIDTCLSCYLTDHHNRPGEWLAGVPVDNETTYQAVLDMLLDEARAYAPEEAPDDAALEAAARDCFSSVTDMAKPFDSSLDPPDPDYDSGETCFAWFLFTWTIEEENEAA